MVLFLNKKILVLALLIGLLVSPVAALANIPEPSLGGQSSNDFLSESNNNTPVSAANPPAADATTAGYHSDTDFVTPATNPTPGTAMTDSTGDYSPELSSLGSGFDTSFNQLFGGSGQSLEKLRQDAEEACKAQQSPMVNISKITGSLQDTLSKGFQKGLNQVLNNIFTQQIPGLLNNVLRQQLPQLIQQEMMGQLPNLLTRDINNRLNSGQTIDQINQAMPQMLELAMQQVMASLTQSQLLIDLIKNGLGQSLVAPLADEFSNQVPTIIKESDLAEQIDGVVASSSQVISNTPLSGDKQETISQNMLTGVEQSATQGVKQSGGLNNLADQMAQDFVNKFLPTIQSQILANVPNLISQMSSSLGGFSSILNRGGFSGLNLSQGSNGGFQFSNNITRDLGFDLSPISQSVAGPLGEAARTGIMNAQIGSALNSNTIGTGTAYGTPYNAVTLGNLQNDLSGIPGAANTDIGQQVFSSAAGPDGIGYIDRISGDAQSSVSGASGKIGSNAVSGINFGGIGDSLKGALSGSLSNGLAGLVDQIPFVGGLLSPIVQQVTEQALNQLLGLGGGSPIGISAAGVGMAGVGIFPISGGSVGIAQTGLGNTMATEFGFAASNMNTASISGNTKTSNQNEDRDYKEQQEHKSFLTQACTHLKVINEEIQTMNNYWYIHVPDSRDANGKAINAGRKQFGAFTGQSFNRIENGQQQGQPAYITNIGNYVGDEVRNQTQVFMNDLQSQGVRQVDKNLVIQGLVQNQARQSTLQGRIGASDVWTEQRNQAFLNGQSQSPLDDLVEVNRYDAGNNYFNAARLAMEELERQAGQTAAESVLQAQIGQGWLPVRTCIQMTEDGTACVQWKTITDPQMIKALAEAYETSPLRLAETGGYQSEAQAPDLFGVSNRIAAGANLTNDIKSIYEGQDPCQGDTPCPNTGWSGGQYQSDPQVLTRISRYQASSWQDKLAAGFNRGLETVLNNTLGKVSGLATGQVNNLMSGLRGQLTHLTSGLDSSGNVSFGAQIQLQNYFRNVLSNDSSFTGDSNQLNSLVLKILNALLPLIKQALAG